MDSAIATITEQGAIYRGVNCIDLAEKDTLEHTATLLWDVTASIPLRPTTAQKCPTRCGRSRRPHAALRRSTVRFAVLALAASADPACLHARAGRTRAVVGARIVRLIVATMLNRAPSAEPLHLQIANAWAPDNKHAADLIRRALVLLADHELNASTFHRALRGLDRASISMTPSLPALPR